MGIIHIWFHSSSSRAFLAAMTIIFFILSTTSEAKPNDTLPLTTVKSMADWCDETTSNTDLCRSLTTNLNKTLTLEQVTRLGMRIMQAKLKEGITRIDSSILNNTSTDIKIKRSLESCRRDYNKVIYRLNEASKMLTTTDLKDQFIPYLCKLHYQLLPCDQASPNGMANPVEGIESQFSELADTIACFAIIPRAEMVAPDDDS